MTAFIYSFGWSGGWHFDDAANLNKLLAVFGEGKINWSAAQDFVLSGDAGPLGRPVALASFLVDGSAWPFSPRAFLYTNSMLHVLNGLLLCGLWLAVLRQRGHGENQAQWVAVTACILWLLQPLLVSGVLMAVQRMVLLSSTFMLVGAWIYVLGRACIVSNPTRGWVMMLTGLGGGTLLGVFTKEQAALLPLMLWVLDGCLLRKPELSSRQHLIWQVFKLFAFYVPAFVIGVYLLRIVLNAEGSYTNRDYGLGERLWTQSVILWDYLSLVVIPRAFAFGPFHDDYPIYSTSLIAVVASLAWLGLLIIFWKLRHKSVWPLFALLWFTAAHLVESTVVPLELYFEHRNYLAIAGPLLTLVMLVVQWANRERSRQAIAVSMVSLYGVLLAFVLWQVTSLFGQNPVAAQIWHEQHPKSARAAQYLASGLSERGDVQGALQVLDNAVTKQQEVGALSLQGLQLACVLGKSHEELHYRLQTVLDELPRATKRFSINDPLTSLQAILNDGDCNGFLTRDMLVVIASTALANENLSRIPLERSNLHYFLATLYIDNKNLGRTMHHLETAMQAVPQIQTMQIMVNVLLSAGLKQEALELMDEYVPNLPKNPWLRKKQQRQWQQLRERLES